MTRSAIVFDLDDTLFAERDYAFSGFAAVAARFANELHAPFDIDRRMRELFDSPNRNRIFNVIVAESDRGDPDRLVLRMIEAFRNHTPRIALAPDADAALRRLRTTHCLGIITDGYSVSQNSKIDALNLRARVDEIVVTDDWGREFWKPHPRAFAEIATRLRVAPPDCTYVADNPAKDFVAPNSLGWRTVRVRRPGSIYAGQTAPPGGDAHAIIESLDAI